MPLISYLSKLSTSRTILWCYLIWWAVNVANHFDATPRIWLTSLGLSGIIGLALVLSMRTSSAKAVRLDPWVVFRLFLMPFCVSSFSALVKEAGYLLVFPPSWRENAQGAALIVLFLIVVRVVKRGTRIPMA
ncbi:MAG: hypothetical protein KA004_13990 [Verrucomicrobiales bacterium]|nr:hypothetical protein [Verrucomicrobiales bacterium]